MITPRKKSVAAVRRQFKACCDRIARERDLIRDMISDMQQIEEDCTEAVEEMEHTADVLSRYI